MAAPLAAPRAGRGGARDVAADIVVVALR